MMTSFRGLYLKKKLLEVSSEAIAAAITAAKMAQKYGNFNNT